MIPPIIHYCWFGKHEKPESVIKCIESWKKFAHTYKIMEWNENNFDVDKYLYAKQAFDASRYAFVSDVARFVALYSLGGIYLDTDVELIKPIDILLNNILFMGFDQRGLVSPGLIIGATKQHFLLNQIIDYYTKNPFLLKNGIPNTTTVVTIVSDILKSNGIQLEGKPIISDDLTIYPWDYFDPYDYENNVMHLTENTYTIHYYTSSWKSKKDMSIYNIGKKLKRIIGASAYDKVARFKHKHFG